MTILPLVVAEQAYGAVFAFVNQLPKEQCHVLSSDERLTVEEQAHIERCLTSIAQGDYSEFDDWNSVNKLSVLNKCSKKPREEISRKLE